jgi:hypothetical protein
LSVGESATYAHLVRSVCGKARDTDGAKSDNAVEALLFAVVFVATF